MSCSICCEDYTEKLRRPIQCPECKNSICLNCFKKHMNEDRNLKCMFPDCEKEFSFIDISKITQNISFSNEIMDKLALITLDEEKNFLPKRQKIAKKILEKEKFEKREKERTKLIYEIRTERYKLERKLKNEYESCEELESINFKLLILHAERNNLYKLYQNKKYNEIKPLDEKINNIDKESQTERENLGIESKDRNYTFIKQCSFKNCKGFLETFAIFDEKGWKCTICEKFTCRKCHEPLVSTINENDKKVKHTCNEDIVANLKEMKKDTKPCPKCGQGIFKIDGCNSMFCIDCQTYFDWKTSKIYKRSVHNPDAVRWMREQGKAIPGPVDDVCTDPFINNTVYYNWMARIARHRLDKRTYDTIMNLVNYGVHLTEVVLRRYNDTYQNKTENFSVKYLLEEDYTESRWTRDIRKTKKQQMFNKEWRNIISLLIEVMKTVLGNIRSIFENNIEASMEKIFEQLELIPKVLVECNQKFDETVICFNSKKKSRFYEDRSDKKYLFEIYYR